MPLEAHSAGAEKESGGVDLDEIRMRVDTALDEFLSTKSMAAADTCLPPLIETVRASVAGGKRMRPLFCHCGWLAAGGAPDVPGVALIGAALELFHSFALIHDDIMDGSDLRRGRPTAHRALAAGHPDPADRGAAERFGTSAAILLGDLCLVWSDELLHAAELGPGLTAARPLIDAMRTEVMAGQFLDLQQDPTGDRLRRAWRIIRLKTAGYTVERPLQIGAALAGAGPELLAALGAYGRPLGEAFQLRDDLLGVFGDPGVTGKPALDDLREGKHTVLMALTWRRADAAQRAALRARHGDPELDEDGAAELRAVIRATGADTAVERLIRERTRRALAALAAAPIPAPVRRTLAGLAEAVGDRDR